MDFFNLAWLIPLLPLGAFLFITCCLPLYRSKQVSDTVAIAAMLAATILAWGVLLRGATRGFQCVPAVQLPPILAGASGPFAGFGDACSRSFLWMTTGQHSIRMGYYLDAPVALMLAMVTTISLLIHLYTAGYMAEDPRYSRFFSYISFFTAAMLGMVLADNLLLFFICWELMGLCSYLLIGFWYYRPAAYRAARKAFITTRIGDVGMLLGIVFLYREAGSLSFGMQEGVDFAQIFNPTFLERISTSPTVFGFSVATGIALLLFIGTIGKSAQLPLHVWLPDAMEGPTPVSALIHAATMVAAGCFLIVRTYPIFLASEVLPVVAVVGAATALFAALIAVAQFDIKRILAYSTISQLGFMVAALGVGGWVAGSFHLLTHAFFKALLFLGAGSVIHALEHWMVLHHEPVDLVRAQDIRAMGGLRRTMPITCITYLVGVLALAGIPPFSGFWSKDEVLTHAFDLGFGSGNVLGVVVYLVLSVAAFLTAFYMMRQVTVVFFGPFRGLEPRRTDVLHSEEVPVEVSGDTVAMPMRSRRGAMIYEIPNDVVQAPALSDDVGVVGDGEHHRTPSESPWTMSIPLVLLACFAALTGFANAAPLGIHWLPSLLGQEAAHFSWPVAGVATALSLAGIVLAWMLYRNAFASSTDPDPLETLMPGAFRLLTNGFYIDTLYGVTVGKANQALSVAFARLDRAINTVVDGVGYLWMFIAKIDFILDDFVLNQGADWLARTTTAAGDRLRRTVTGKIQDYTTLVVIGTLVVGLVWLYALR